jgi:hypothetical protein
VGDREEEETEEVKFFISNNISYLFLLFYHLPWSCDRCCPSPRFSDEYLLYSLGQSLTGWSQKKKKSDEFFSSQSSLCDEGTREESHKALFADTTIYSPQQINSGNLPSEAPMKRPSNTPRGGSPATPLQPIKKTIHFF